MAVVVFPTPPFWFASAIISAMLFSRENSIPNSWDRQASL
jgi:hypothetical protein